MVEPTKQEFCADSLEFREITQDYPKHTKNLLQQKEAVHRMNSTAELEQNRLAPPGYIQGGGIWDKHCYGLFVPGSDVPEICVYTKLLSLPADEAGYVANAQAPNTIIDMLEKPGEVVAAPNTVVFYSITNRGLLLDGKVDPHHPIKVTRGSNGCGPGEELIHRVAEHVHSHYQVNNYFTLSPLRKGINGDTHGFAEWLERAVAKKAVVTPSEMNILRRIHAGLPHSQDAALIKVIRHIHQHYNELAPADQAFFGKMMQALGTYYLAHEKSETNSRMALDAVGGGFHMPNGAEVANVHYLPPGKVAKDDSIGSIGLMVNYRYSHDPEILKERKARYKDGQVTADIDVQKNLDERLNTLDKPQVRCHSPVQAGKLSGLKVVQQAGI